MPRTDFPSAERQRRSRIAQLAHYQHLLRGTLTLRHNTCGKPQCRCTRGEPHLALYLMQSENGKPRQLFIPRSWEKRVRQAVQDYQELQKLLEELSQREWKRVKERRE